MLRKVGDYNFSFDQYLIFVCPGSISTSLELFCCYLSSQSIQRAVGLSSYDFNHQRLTSFSFPLLSPLAKYIRCQGGTVMSRNATNNTLEGSMSKSGNATNYGIVINSFMKFACLESLEFYRLRNPKRWV